MERGESDQRSSSKGSTWAKGVKMNRPPERNPNVFGEIPSFPVGSTFANRIECSEAGVHGPWRAGIHGNQNDGAFSIVLSGGYEDDEDHGDTLTYTGQGGRDTKGSKLDQMMGKTLWEGPQSADQEWTRGNKALKISSVTKNPVRVIRGHTLVSRYAPAEGYRFDGLYEVVKAWRAEGKTGFMTCRFTFQRLPGQPPIPGTPLKTHMRKTASSKSRPTPTAKVPSLLRVAGSSEPVSTAEQPDPNIGTSHVKKTRLDKPSSSTVKRSERSDIAIPHVNKAAPSKLEKHQRINAAAGSSRQLSQAEGPIRRLLDAAPLPMVKVEPIHTLITPRPAPTASLGRIKRRLDNSDEDTEGDNSVNSDSSGNLRKLKKPAVKATSTVIGTGSQGDKWATTAGKKKYEGLHFKKKKLEQL